MRNFMDSIAGALSHRISSLAIGAAILAVLPVLAEGAEVMHVRWEDLSMVNGQTVRIFLPGGPVIGKASTVEAEALVVDVKKTSDRKAYPKGVLRVPRERLHRLEMQTKGKAYRVLFALLGACLGSGGGSAAGYGIADGNPAATVAAFAGLTAAGVAGGYFAGNALDKHWTTIEILP